MYCRTINRFGEMYHFPREEIITIDELEPGDHVAVEQNSFYWHHMIVEKVKKEEGKFQVIHYYNSSGEFVNETFPEKAIVQRSTLKFEDKRWHRIVYEKVSVNSAAKVLIKARTSLNLPKYNAFLNNCEHFCTWCKINSHASPQVEYLELWILRHWPACCLRLLADIAVIAKMSFPQLLKGVVISSLKCVVNAVGMVFEFAVVSVELAIVGKKCENKEITDEEFYEIVMRKLCTSFFISVLCVVGHMIIPVPVVGCFVGLILGHCAGFIANYIAFSRPSPWSRFKSIIKRIWELAIK